MARGKPDYWHSFVTSNPMFGGPTVYWSEKENRSLNAGTNYELINYTVPTERILHVTGIHISAYLPGITYCYIYVGAMEIGHIYYDQTLNLNLHSSAVLIAHAGELVKVKVYNIDDCAISYNAVLMGFLEVAIE